MRRCEHEADDAKRALRVALRDSFTTPIDAEDIYTLSERLDALLNGAKDLVREAEVMEAAARPRPWPPWPRRSRSGSGTWPRPSRCSARTTTARASTPPTRPTPASSRPASSRHTYRAAMSATLDLDDVRELAARRELYRRFTHLGDLLAQIGDRVWYAVIKES